MTMIGADVEALRRLASDLTQGSGELRQLSAELARSIADADEWQGPDATRCKQEWGRLAQTRMATVAEALAAAGTLLDTEAEQQETGSAATAGAGPVAAAPGVSAGPTRATAPTGPSGRGADFWSGVRDLVGGLWKAKGVVGKVKGLATFLGALAKDSFFARTRGAARAVESLLGQIRAGTTIESMLARIPLLGTYAAGLARLVPIAALEKWMPFISRASRFMPLLSAALAIPDLLDGGGHAGLRGGITRVLAGGAIVGGLTLAGAALLGGTAALVAAAPVTAAVAAGAGVLYGAWSLATYTYDHSAFVRGVVDHAGTAITGAWHSASAAVSTAVSTGYRHAVDAARSWAAGLLGLHPAGAGA